MMEAMEVELVYVAASFFDYLPSMDLDI